MNPFASSEHTSGQVLYKHGFDLYFLPYYMYNINTAKVHLFYDYKIFCLWFPPLLLIAISYSNLRIIQCCQGGEQKLLILDFTAQGTGLKLTEISKFYCKSTNWNMLGPTLLKKVVSGKVEWVLFISLEKIRWKNLGPTENDIDTHFKWKWNFHEKQNNFQLKRNVLFQLTSKWEFILKMSIRRHFKLSLQIASKWHEWVICFLLKISKCFDFFFLSLTWICKKTWLSHAVHWCLTKIFSKSKFSKWQKTLSST